MKKKLVVFMIVCCTMFIGCKSENNSSELDNNIPISKGEIQSSNNDNTKLNNSDNKILDYIANNLLLESATVKICEGYDGNEVGLIGVSIKNNGDKSINELTITVYFQDADGKDIAENSFLVIGGFMGGSTLKPNYSWKMESDKYMAFKIFRMKWISVETE